MKYQQWSWGWGSLGIGFDKNDMTQLHVNLDLCLQHRYLTLELAFMGLQVDFHLYERTE